MYQFIRPLLFALPPETAHRLTLVGLDFLAATRLSGLISADIHDPVELMGLTFPNRVGLAAGLDKNGEHITGLGSLGFGFIEVGTVTPRPQPGNPRPRLFRLPRSKAIINRMGFNNHGLDALMASIQGRRFSGILGINIGKNADTPLDAAAGDYLACLRRVYPVADYISVNISSPNTPGLRSLQNRDELIALLQLLVSARNEAREQVGRYVPLLLKIAPDLDRDALRVMAETFLQAEIDGVIATNTTIERHGLGDDPHGSEAGGLSGAPLKGRSTEVVAALAEDLGGKIPIIAAGGVMSGDDAREKIAAGASLVQLYTGLIYRGPGLVGQVARSLRNSR